MASSLPRPSRPAAPHDAASRPVFLDLLGRIIHVRPTAAADLAAISGVLGPRRLRRIAADTTRRLDPASAQPDSHLRGFATVVHAITRVSVAGGESAWNR